MSRKMTKSDLSRDEISLLLNSEEPKNTKLYGNLYDILLQVKELKAITLEELENQNLNYSGVSALAYNKFILIDNATKEWQATTNIIDNPERTARCQLCNAPKLRYECHIRNTHNNIELLVGSECVNKFKIDGYIDQKKQLIQIQKGHKVVERKNEFYKHFPDYENIIYDSEEYFSTLPILLPDTIYFNLKEVVERIRLIATKYINEGKKPFESRYSSFKLFELAINQFSKLQLKADAHIVNNKDNPLACSRSEIDWLISQNKLKLLQKISENNGIYTLDTLKNMYSANYIQKHIDLIMDRNHSELIKFEKFNDNNLVFSFNKLGYQPPILFQIRLSDFMQQIGANCIIDESFTYRSKNILSISNIINSKNNLLSILGYIDNMMNLLNCVFLIDDITNSLYLYRKGDRAVRLFSNYAFIQTYYKYILLSDDQIKKYLFNIVKGNNNVKWITPELQSKQGIDEKVGMLYKEYKNSHEYNIHLTGRKRYELMTYSVSNNSITNIVEVNFNSPEYISLQRNKLEIGDNQLRNVDYGLYIYDDSLNPIYKKGDILFIQTVQKVKNGTTIIFATKEGIVIKECYSENEELRSVFDFINIPKKECVAYGKVVYCLHNALTSDNLDNIEIFVVDNPKHCLECSKKCTYKLINYIQSGKTPRKINVAICPKCNKYYICKNSYITFNKSKKESNIVFKV